MEQKTNLVNWFEIYVDDMSRAQSFYENVLGKKLEKMPMPVYLEASDKIWKKKP